MYLLIFLLSLPGSLIADFTGYRQGAGTYKIFPDILPEIENIQLGARNFYGIKNTLLLYTAYNRKEFTSSAELIKLETYYTAALLGFSLRYPFYNVKTGLSVVFDREFKPTPKNSIDFSLSTGIQIFKDLGLHSGISGFPSRIRIPLLVDIHTKVGETLILLEGERYMPLKAEVSQSFILSRRVKILLFMSTVPYKIGINVSLSFKKIILEAFSEIHDILGQSGGAMVEYAPSKSYN